VHGGEPSDLHLPNLFMVVSRRIFSVSFVDDQAVSNVTIKAKLAVSRPIDSKHLPQNMLGENGYNSEGWYDECAWEVESCDYDSLDEEHVDEEGFNYWPMTGHRFVYHVQVRFQTFLLRIGGEWEDACRVSLDIVRVYCI
jgi:hypothetical protein